MKKITKEIAAEFYLYDEVAPATQALLTQAKTVRKNVQAPYSNFLCGAAIVFDDGTISAGCNHEVCSFSQTSHAEQNALASHVSQYGPSVINEVAIVAAPRSVAIDFSATPKETGLTFADASVPCGHCLQTLWENCDNNPDVPLWMWQPDLGLVSKVTIGDAFPLRFGPEELPE